MNQARREKKTTLIYIAGWRQQRPKIRSHEWCDGDGQHLQSGSGFWRYRFLKKLRRKLGVSDDQNIVLICGTKRIEIYSDWATLGKPVDLEYIIEQADNVSKSIRKMRYVWDKKQEPDEAQWRSGYTCQTRIRVETYVVCACSKREERLLASCRRRFKNSKTNRKCHLSVEPYLLERVAQVKEVTATSGARKEPWLQSLSLNQYLIVHQSQRAEIPEFRVFVEEIYIYIHVYIYI